MKITDVEVLRMQAFTEPQNNWLFVRVHTDEGISGLGEGSLQYKDAALAAEIENFALYLRGKDPLQIEHIWTSLHRRVTWSGGAVTMSAISAIDLALWDIKGKVAKLPVYQLLGGKARREGKITIGGKAGRFRGLGPIALESLDREGRNTDPPGLELTVALRELIEFLYARSTPAGP